MGYSYWAGAPEDLWAMPAQPGLSFHATLSCSTRLPWVLLQRVMLRLCSLPHAHDLASTIASSGDTQAVKLAFIPGKAS